MRKGLPKVWKLYQNMLKIGEDLDSICLGTLQISAMEFEQIYNTYFRSVYLYVMQLSGNEDLAEEISSETFYKAINSIDRFRGECDMRVWL